MNYLCPWYSYNRNKNLIYGGSKMYNEKYGILFSFNPMMQCILGRFFGWMLVIEASNETRPLKTSDKILLNYSSASQWNKLVKHIQGFE
jgi:hypothetical protein